ALPGLRQSVLHTGRTNRILYNLTLEIPFWTVRAVRLELKPGVCSIGLLLFLSVDCFGLHQTPTTSIRPRCSIHLFRSSYKAFIRRFDFRLGYQGATNFDTGNISPLIY